MNIETKLKTWKKKTISNIELKSLLCVNSDDELYDLASDAVAKGFISPIETSGTNGNRVYPVYLKYRIILSEDYSDALAEIDMLHPEILKTGYLQSKPDLYLKYRDQLRKLNSYLFKAKSLVSVSRKERSFEIFDEEKQLEDSSFRGLLDRLSLNSDALNYYNTPEYCFNDFIPAKKAKMTLLICENKDIWFNIRRRMYEDEAYTILDEHIDGVVYGCGNKVSEKDSLSAYTRFMRADFVQYYYWGDIDRAGLNIFLSLKKNNPGLEIKLFTPGYIKMLQFAQKRNVPDSDDHRERIGNYKEIYDLFSGELRDFLIANIESNKRIPQEIINYEILLAYMR